jgi:methylisocitrate lyase
LEQERPLQIFGTVNAYVAIMAEKIGIKAIYLSGAGVANSSHGIPDLGITNVDDVLMDVRRITSAVVVPLLVDIDTGFGGAFAIARTVKEMIRAGAAGVHIEDQISAKRCGHRTGKVLVPAGEMVDRIKAAVDARTEEGFIIMARTDAFEGEGLEGTIDRASAYVEVGADMLFPEALGRLEQFTAVRRAVGVPVLANMTEFGKTPLFTVSELAGADVDMVLYPLSTTRAMNFAAMKVMKAIRKDGTQRGVLEIMQTRTELYDLLGYWDYERKLDDLYGKRGE